MTAREPTLRYSGTWPGRSQPNPGLKVRENENQQVRNRDSSGIFFCMGTVEPGSAKRKRPHRRKLIARQRTVAQGYQYTGACPVELKFSWGLIANNSTDVTYHFIAAMAVIPPATRMFKCRCRAAPCRIRRLAAGREYTQIRELQRMGEDPDRFSEPGGKQDSIHDSLPVKDRSQPLRKRKQAAGDEDDSEDRLVVARQPVGQVDVEVG